MKASTILNYVPSARYFMGITIMELIKEILTTIVALVFITLLVGVSIYAIHNTNPEDSVFKNVICLISGGFGLLLLYFIPTNYILVAWKVFKHRVEKC